MSKQKFPRGGKVMKFWLGDETFSRQIFLLNIFTRQISKNRNFRRKLTKLLYSLSMNVLFNALILRWILI